MSATRARRRSRKLWVRRVMETSNALDVPPGTFSLPAKEVARELKASALRSKRRKAEPYRSALSMLVFYLNRAGKKLPARRRRELEKAKVELGKLFGKDRKVRARAAARTA